MTETVPRSVTTHLSAVDRAGPAAGKDSTAAAISVRLGGLCSLRFPLCANFEVLNGISQVDPFAADPTVIQGPIQQPASRPDETFALLVLDISGRLADQHPFRCSVSLSEYRSAGSPCTSRTWYMPRLLWLARTG
jgi:hypothetical protein